MYLHIIKITLYKVDHYFVLKLVSKMNINMKQTLIAMLIVIVIISVSLFICHGKFFPWNDSIKEKSYLFCFT